MAPEAPATSACSCSQHRLTPLVAERATSSLSFSSAQQGESMMEVREITACKGAAKELQRSCKGPAKELQDPRQLGQAGHCQGLELLSHWRGRARPQGQPAPCFGDPHLPPGWKSGLGAQVGVRTAPGGTEKGWTLAAHPATPWPQHGAAPAHLGLCCVLHPSGQQHPSWVGAPQLQLFKALSPQLQGTMLMPTLILIPSSPSSAPFYPRQCQKRVPSPCRGQRAQTRRGFV